RSRGSRGRSTARSRSAAGRPSDRCRTGSRCAPRAERSDVAHAAPADLACEGGGGQTVTAVLVHGARRAPTQRPRARRYMKAEIQPAYVETQVTCTCGNSFTTRSTKPDGVISTEVCSACHPFYTGKQKFLDTGGRVARFQA